MSRTILVWGLAAVLAASTAGAQSLGAVARKEEARRKTIKQPSKVYTNEDLKKIAESLPPPPAPDAAPAKTEADKQQKAPEEKPAEPEEPAKDEAYWRGRITQAREQLSRTRTYMEAMQSRINALTNDFYARDDPAQRAQIANERQRALGELDRLKGEEKQQIKAIADIEEEARQAGVPPGWLR